MERTELFEYLAAFVTIVLALALSDLIMSTHRLIKARRRVKWSSLPLLAAAFIYLAVLSEFFTLWDDLETSHLTFYGLVWAMVTPTLTSMAAFAVLPDDVPSKGLNLEKYYFDNRRYLAALLALVMITDRIRIFQWAEREGYLGRTDLWLWFGGFSIAWFTIFAVIWFAAKRRTQLIALVSLLLVANVGFSGWEAGEPSTEEQAAQSN